MCPFQKCRKIEGDWAEGTYVANLKVGECLEDQRIECSMIDTASFCVERIYNISPETKWQAKGSEEAGKAC